MEILNKILEAISSPAVASAIAFFVGTELWGRWQKTFGKISWLYAAGGVFHKLGAICDKIGDLLDKIAPNRTNEP